jgi:hypothetical protein
LPSIRGMRITVRVILKKPVSREVLVALLAWVLSLGEARRPTHMNRCPCGHLRESSPSSYPSAYGDNYVDTLHANSLSLLCMFTAPI